VVGVNNVLSCIILLLFLSDPAQDSTWRLTWIHLVIGIHRMQCVPAAQEMQQVALKKLRKMR
jgi:hypothetical protein